MTTLNARFTRKFQHFKNDMKIITSEPGTISSDDSLWVTDLAKWAEKSFHADESNLLS